MAEYIDRDAFKKEYLFRGYIPKMSEREFDCFPVSDDVAPVVHGRWITRGGNLRCSICDKKAKLDCSSGIGGWPHEFEQAKTTFCPNCGAKMDLITWKRFYK